MKIIFFASGNIAVPTLEALLKSKHSVVCVVTSPDKKKGRHLKESFTPIKTIAKKKGLAIFQPTKLSSSDSLNNIKSLKPDIFVVFSYGKILPKGMLDIAKVMPINIHASLLPQYRGAAPINKAIINGDAKTGITIIRMNDKMDEGDIISQYEIKINELDNYITIEQKLSQLAAEAIVSSLDNIALGKASFLRQDASMASCAPKLKKEDGRMDWNKSAKDIRNLIRGMLPWPCAFTVLKKQILKIWESEIVYLNFTEKYSPGEIISISKDGILVATKKNALLIKELQAESGKRLKAWQFVQGRNLAAGSHFE